MLTYERQQLILSLLEEKKIVKLQELVDATGASESTIRRDLTELEEQKLLKRVHGGASLISKKFEEPTIEEKQSKYKAEKSAIGKYAASLVNNGDCIFIDAGTTTRAMVEYLQDKEIVVVTNGLNIITELIANNIRTYVTGGYVKEGTHAFVGRGAVDSLQTFQFDKAFVGTNGVDSESGYTTPDPEEAQIKELAIRKANETFVLADHSKFGDTSFAKIADLSAAIIITSKLTDLQTIKQYKKKTDIKVVDSE
ncbi:DeoR family transcriptional regulator, fructose operon transcriptional repressor [Evansella caseinilytica]|uniref:DeoR family transcriptional regulator, fructose operon transcriptional repressor n=1 Tax=Evansella caseinilytica TaxID=1503961 RepID=A0A1H3J231_9BACI|nr:DeoR/GlpR family DNA-binding transcription regulator [Evansella caseinilytica]SDY33991.1 DeoR family transcriptional regulator, fructose operon transcriptional repressor [Evansella caseinilytica]